MLFNFHKIFVLSGEVYIAFVDQTMVGYFSQNHTSEVVIKFSGAGHTRRTSDVKLRTKALLQ